MDDDALVLTRHKIDVDAYHRMGEAGIFTDGERVELIDGEVLDMAPIGQGHYGTVNRLNTVLVTAFGDRAVVSPQNPVRLDRHNEPQPDFAVLRARADFYGAGAPPGPADVLLLIEVADSSLRFDRSIKLPLYARAGVPEVWIVDLRAGAIDVHRRLVGGAYRETATLRPGDTVSIEGAPDIVLEVRRLIGE